MEGVLMAELSAEGSAFQTVCGPYAPEAPIVPAGEKWTPDAGAWVVLAIPPSINGIPNVVAVALLDEMAAHNVARSYVELGCRTFMVDARDTADDEPHTIEEYGLDA